MSIEQISEIIKTVGLIVAGLWAAWTFHKLQRVRTAELKNDEATTAIQKSRMEQDELRTRLRSQQPQLGIQLNIFETASLNKTYKSFLCVTVLLKNEGEQNLQVDFDASALIIGRIIPGKDGKQLIDVHRSGPSYFVHDTDEPQFFSSRIFRVGQTRQMVMDVLPITGQGTYLIQFHAVYSKVPFDGEKSSGKNQFLINAVEQTIYFATGKPTEPTDI
ncbi:MAG: hypothetical protein ABI472_06555 [Ginsengibacter sp.]